MDTIQPKVDEQLYKMLDGTLSKKAANTAFACLIILTHANTGPIMLPAAGKMYFHKAHWLLRHDCMCMMQLLLLYCARAQACQCNSYTHTIDHYLMELLPITGY